MKKFTNLRELTLKGLLSDDDYTVLKAFLVLQHRRLEYLEVDFIDWAEMKSRFNLPDEDEDEDEDEDDSTPLSFPRARIITRVSYPTFRPSHSPQHLSKGHGIAF